jgi:type I restriction enzyme S subunit
MSKEKLIPNLRFPEFKNEGDWEECSIESVGDVVTGGTPSKEDVDYWGGDFVWATAQDFKNKYIFNSIQKLTQKGKDKSRVIPKDSVLVTCIASIGLNAINKVDCATNQQINAIICNSKNHFEFVYYSISHNGNRLKNLAGRTAVPIISKSVFEKFIIHKPESPKEQQKIASCLSSLDEVIAAHSQKLDQLKDHKKGLMQNLFPQEGETVPKFRFKEFTDSLRKMGFAELGEIKIGLTHKPDYIVSGVPFLSSKNISGGFIDFKNIQHISQEKFDSMPNSTKPKLGDILFTRVGSNLGNPIILEDDIEFGIFVSLGFFRVNKKAFNYYIKYWMESDLFWKQVNQKVAGGAKDNLNSTWLKEFELYIPSVQEQQKIASCLSSLDKLITAQAEKIEQLKLHKKGLMQGLFPKIND